MSTELVGLAASRRIPIHFLSCRGVLNLDPSALATKPSEASAVRFLPLQDGSNGYVASKWASETYLENVARVLGIPVFIHHFLPSNGPSASHHVIMGEFLRHTRLVGALPEPDGDLDLVLARTLMQRIYICNSARDGVNDTGKPIYINHGSEIKLDGTRLLNPCRRVSGPI